MKKLIIAAAIVCAAVASQAAKVEWGGAIATEAFDQPAVGTQAALLWSAEAFTGAATSLDKFEVGGAADNGGKIVSTYTLDAGDSDNWNFTGSWANEGKDANGYYAILTLNDAGTYASYTDMGSISGTTATSPQQNLKYNDGWGESETSMYFAENGYTVQVGAVPEPTSGLLLLIGVAGLALRRRRA